MGVLDGMNKICKKCLLHYQYMYIYIYMCTYKSVYKHKCMQRKKSISSIQGTLRGYNAI